MITVTTKVNFTHARRGRKRLSIVPDAEPAKTTSRVPRISKLMALAIRFDGLLRSGVVADLSELARLARVTQPRMTQIMNLNHLAPDIQEQLLTLAHALASVRQSTNALASSLPQHLGNAKDGCGLSWQRQLAPVTPETRAAASWEIARDNVYADVPSSAPVKLTDAFVERGNPLVDGHLEGASVRLASILNDMFK